MFDYAALTALAAVVREGSFERAARALHLTPSALSQRVRQLEERTGRILVKRATPCVATPEGSQLLRHVETVALMEHEVLQSLPWLRSAGAAQRPTLRIAVNADSLASWFMAALAAFTAEQDVLLDLVIEDQEHSLDLMRQGEVLAAVTGHREPVQGFDSVALGGLRYAATASPSFVARHFAAGVTREALLQAPSLRFNQKDALQSTWIASYIGEPLTPPCHWIASSQGFVEATVAGLGWGMNPIQLVRQELADGRLCELAPGQELTVALYWHCAGRPSLPLQQLGAQVRAAARANLVAA